MKEVQRLKRLREEELVTQGVPKQKLWLWWRQLCLPRLLACAGLAGYIIDSVACPSSKNILGHWVDQKLMYPSIAKAGLEHEVKELRTRSRTLQFRKQPRSWVCHNDGDCHVKLRVSGGSSS
jgi:hypothetical protein